MKRTAIPAAALMLALAACDDQPDEALPPEGELEGALPSVETADEETTGEAEPEIETIGEPEAPVMENGTTQGADMYGGEDGRITDPPGSKLQWADPPE